MGDEVIEWVVEIASGSVVKGDRLMTGIGGARPSLGGLVAKVMFCSLASTAVGETPSREESPLTTETSLRSTGVLAPILVGVPSPLDGAGGGRWLDSLALFATELSTDARDDRSSRLATEDSRPLMLELELLNIDDNRRFGPDLGTTSNQSIFARGTQTEHMSGLPFSSLGLAVCGLSTSIGSVRSPSFVPKSH